MIGNFVYWKKEERNLAKQTSEIDFNSIYKKHSFASIIPYLRTQLYFEMIKAYIKIKEPLRILIK